jgi:2-polyprenyl-3-methyl-5-hydroxy-6-metoxy-1,4-benzoquinol methylase
MLITDPWAQDLAAQRSVYDNYTQLKGWDRPFEYDAELAEYYGGELGTGDLTDKSLLEIGFGSGGLLAWASDRGAKVAGAEINEASREAAMARGIALVPSDLTAAAAAYPEGFDFIVAFDVFEHFRVSEIVANLAACERMLKPMGRLLLRFPNAQSPFGLVHQYADITHITPLSGEILRQLTAGTHLQVIGDRPAYAVFGPSFARRLVRLARYLLQRLIERLCQFVYATPVSFAPVMVVTLGKRIG